MRRQLYFITFYFLLYHQSFGGQGEYAVSNIPSLLLKGADVVKRSEEQLFEITEKNSARYIRKVAYTILNEAGERWAYFSEGYDKLRYIESFEGALYDAAGNKLKSLKKADLKDESGNSDASLADDFRIKWHSFFYKAYPFTVEYEVVVKYKGTMFLPRWMPQERPVMAVQQSLITVISPMSNLLRYKMFNYKSDPVIITDTKSNKVYTWQVKDIAPVKTEYASPDWFELTTSVFMATEKFILQDYEGSNVNWKEFGRFVYDLKNGRDELPEETKQQVHQLIEGVTDPREKISRLYSYMQQNSRYISVQLGVGGWQPFDAKYVATKKYGDCKALSNYMYSLLKEAGIRSVYTITGRGDDINYLLTDLPCSQFNHAILFVPLENDTAWLECTSQTLAAGYLGGDNSNRLALAVDENGGTLVSTPQLGLKENLQKRNIKAELNSEGTMELVAATHYTGMQQDNLHLLINNLSTDKVKDYLHEQFEFATYDISNFKYKEEKKVLPAIDELLNITVSNYATITGKRLFIVPNVMNRSNRKITNDEERKSDIVFTVAYIDQDSVEITLPVGYITESIPADVTVSTKFGKYSCSVKYLGNKLFYYRNIEKYAGRFPARDYSELVKFYEVIYKADRNKVVLVKNETTRGF